MKLRFLLIILPVLHAFPSFGQQDTLSLRELIRAAEEYATIGRRSDVYAEINQQKLEALQASNLPSAQVYGKAWYQSDAITVVTPGGPGLEIDRFQYNGGVEIDQKLFDGGMVRSGKELQEVTHQIQQQELDVERYQLGNRVAGIYFRILLVKRNTEVIILKENLLSERVKDVRSAYENGVTSRNDLEKMEAALLVAKQQLLELKQTEEQLLIELSSITGMQIAADDSSVLSDSVSGLVPIVRPEYNLFSTRSDQVSQRAELQKRQNYPRVFAYGQAGYSYPGLNFFENESAPYYLIGARLSWTLFDWKKNHNEASAIRTQSELIDSQLEEFNRNLAAAIRKEQSIQAQLLKIMALDEEVIRQRSSVTKGSEEALRNGVITSSQYLEDMNEEIQARIEQEIHRIQYSHSLFNLQLLQGATFGDPQNGATVN